MLTKKILILALVVFASTVTAAVGETGVTDEKLNVFEMKRKLQDQNKLIQQMTKEVNNVEVSLGMSNKKYLQLAAERAKLEENLSNAKKNVDIDSESYKKSFNQTKNLLMSALLNKLENTENSSDLLARKILIENLQRRLSDLSGIMKTNNVLQQDVNALYARLQESMNTEKELLAVMNDLEERKRELRNNLALETQKKTESQLQFDEEKNKLAINSKAQERVKLKERLAPVQITEEIKIPSQPALMGGEYAPPIYSFNDIEYKKKGVTFNFQGKNEVRATKGGRIAYTGALANYGNVLMIDHGNDTRTVLLGQFDYSVKNGDQVKLGDVIGQTNPRSTGALSEGKIYFEVRKNNLAQNTYLLLDKKTLAKNSSN